jgi:hypothetical protein
MIHCFFPYSSNERQILDQIISYPKERLFTQNGGPAADPMDCLSWQTLDQMDALNSKFSIHKVVGHQLNVPDGLYRFVTSSIMADLRTRWLWRWGEDEEGAGRLTATAGRCGDGHLLIGEGRSIQGRDAHRLAAIGAIMLCCAHGLASMRVRARKVRISAAPAPPRPP